MVNVTFAVPEELHRIMRKHQEIKWAEIARRAMWDYAKKLEFMERITSKSRLTEKDITELDSLVKRGISQKYEALVKAANQ